jgi:hypothetical protein
LREEEGGEKGRQRKGVRERIRFYGGKDEEKKQYNYVSIKRKKTK